MKLRILALIMALSLVVWAQGNSASPAPNSTPAPEAKGCCHHAKAEGKDAVACCGKDKCEMKDAKSCCNGKDKDMQACMDQCKKEGKGCCGDGKECGKAADKTAANCCDGNSCQRRQHTAS